MGSDLYYKLKDWFKDHLNQVLAKSVQESEEALLLFYTREWTRYTTASTFINHIFRYLNRHWVKREIDEGHRHVYDVYTLSLVSWKDYFFKSVHSKVMEGVLKLIQRQREGETVNISLVKKVVESFGIFFMNILNFNF